MKANKIYHIIILIFFIGFSNPIFCQNKFNKKFKELQKKLELINEKGGLAVVGQAVVPANNVTIGFKIAEMDARKQMFKLYKQNSTDLIHEIYKELDINIYPNLNFSMISGCRSLDMIILKAKKNKSICYVLIGMTAKDYYSQFRNELKDASKNTKENYYEIYMNSEIKKKHDKMIEELEKYENEFGF